MKYIKNWNNYHKIEEAVVSAQENINLLNSIQKNPTLPLLMINTSKNNAPYVKLLQDTLKSQGYDLEINGVFDEKTKQAVLDYQSSDGLLKDGKVGKNTWKSILSLNDINVDPKITNVTSPVSKKPIVNKQNKNTSNSTPTTPTTPTTQSNMKFKDSKGNLRDFSELVNAKEGKGEWFNNTEILTKILESNIDNKNFIIALNNLYKEKTNMSLIQFMTKKYSKSLLGGRGFEIGVKLFDMLTNYIISPEDDAQIINFAIDGMGTEDELLKLIINKRSKQSVEYKNKIADAYQNNYNTSLLDDLEDDLDVEDDDDRNLIKKIIPTYTGAF